MFVTCSFSALPASRVLHRLGAEHHAEGDGEQQQAARDLESRHADPELRQQPVSAERGEDESRGGDRRRANCHFPPGGMIEPVGQRDERRHEAHRVDHEQQRHERGDREFHPALYSVSFCRSSRSAAAHALRATSDKPVLCLAPAWLAERSRRAIRARGRMRRQLPMRVCYLYCPWATLPSGVVIRTTPMTLAGSAVGALPLSFCPSGESAIRSAFPPTLMIATPLKPAGATGLSSPSVVRRSAPSIHGRGRARR
jgi:hypothetical protein